MSSMDKDDLPIVSSSFEEDMKIMNFCKDNKNDARCSCVMPEEGIKKLQINTFNPYTCWYAPCKNDTTFKTSLVVQEQKKCNIVLCNVDLGQVTIDDNGTLNVKNNCISSKNFSNVIISQDFLEHSLQEDYNLPDYFSRSALPLLLILGSILFLKV